jgi:hypothetical protein
LPVIACELALPTVAEGMDAAPPLPDLGVPDLTFPPPFDAGADATDAGDGYVCVAIDASAAQVPDASCVLSDGSTCAPGPIDGFLPFHIPPRQVPGSCTTPQIQAFYDGCYGQNATAGTCNAFGSQNSSCYACLVSNSTDNPYGPIVAYPNGDYYFNTPGCVELLEPCNVECAKVFQAGFECQAASCDPVCPGMDMAASIARHGCEVASAMCPCEYYFYQGLNCSDTMMARHSPALPCIEGKTYEDSFKFVCGVFCGP